MKNANHAISLADKFALFDEHWSPRIACELNGQYVKLAKLKGEFIWHRHENEDELFLVVKGVLTIELEDRALVLHPGELAVIPKGTLHRPVCDAEVHVVLVEPKSTLNTGDVTNDRTRDAAWV